MRAVRIVLSDGRKLKSRGFQAADTLLRRAMVSPIIGSFTPPIHRSERFSMTGKRDVAAG